MKGAREEVTMSEISRTTLFGKLGPLPYKAIESATLFCKMRGNPYVELAHWLHQLLQVPDSDLTRLLRHFQVDSARSRATSPTRSIACHAARPRSPISPSRWRSRSSAAGSTRRSPSARVRCGAATFWSGG